MARPMWIGIGIAVASRLAAAAPATEPLERALPPGWSLLITSSELVIRHDRPCYVTSAGSGTMITVELRYRLEPRWTDAQLAAARATNDRLAAELRALSARYRIAAIAQLHGKPAPATPDERARLDAYEAAEARVLAKQVKLPRCQLGDTSVFDGPDTYAALGLALDPPEVATQAHQVVALMKRHCS